eukprot:CAMPEP_0167790076 /NCGR_PEP_ID=MMETSP0111_2-20121227/11090_1 /TAXON_ID=91324 /ORGANISM="Lotharella globosa, Strain CCCM811" /LENGTH=151 /DNA_ID=CAMNT_0007682415 /DNA_START=207 /DNA_END=662 /DNA_ORIENTATION=-
MLLSYLLHAKVRLPILPFSLNLSSNDDLLKLATVGDSDRGLWASGGGTVALDQIDNVLALKDLPEHHVLAVEPRGGDSGDEELRPVGIRTRVRHAQVVLAGVAEGKVFIGEFLAVDGLASGAVTPCEVSGLAHEVRDDTVEAGALVVQREP